MGAIAREYLGARQASSSPLPTSTSKIVQPTTAIALTTTFTPPATCTAGMLSVMPSPGFLVWANEPFPAENQTFSGCYPTEFLKSYTSVSSGKEGTSVVPAMNPLVCPKNYCTANAGDNNYLVCCPTGYQFHAPDTTVDTNRPGYGGTCYSDLTLSQTFTVVAFDTNGKSKTQPFIISTTSMQAFAHPIDGWAETAPSIGCAGQSSSSSLASSSGSGANSGSSAIATPVSSPSETPVSTRKGTSKGTIAGATVGSIAGLAFLIALVFLLLRYRRKNKPPAPPPKTYQMEDDFANRPRGEFHEKEGDIYAREIGTSGRVNEKGTWRLSEQNDGRGAFEVSADPLYEMDAVEQKAAPQNPPNWKERQ